MRRAFFIWPVALVFVTAFLLADAVSSLLAGVSWG